MRLFVALNLPEKERGRIHRGSQALREADFPVRWTDPEQYHLTLKFLGDVHPDRVDAVAQALARVASTTPHFDVDLREFGAFPTLRKPRVLWLGANPSPALRCLKQDVEWGLAEYGFARELRAFHPHLTLGRSTVDGGGGLFRGLEELTVRLHYEGRFTVRSLDLMSSQLGREGPRYTVLSSSPLG